MIHLSSIAKNSPVTLSVAVLAAVTLAANALGADITTEQAAAYIAGAALVVNNRQWLITFIRGAKQYLRDVWAAIRS